MALRLVGGNRATIEQRREISHTHFIVFRFVIFVFFHSVNTIKTVVQLSLKFFFAHDFVNPWYEFLYVCVDSRYCNGTVN